MKTKTSQMKSLQEFADNLLKDTREKIGGINIPQPKTKREKQMFAAGQMTIGLFLKGFTLGVK